MSQLVMHVTAGYACRSQIRNTRVIGAQPGRHAPGLVLPSPPGHSSPARIRVLPTGGNYQSTRASESGHPDRHERANRDRLPGGHFVVV
jgi:hypothetical protein